MVTVQDLINAVEKAPDLADKGFNYCSPFNKNLTAEQREQSFLADRSLLKREIRQFKLCCDWLLECEKRASINPSFGSYSLKHYVERWAKKNGVDDYYVSNGAFIAAAIHMGFEWERIIDSPNARFNISSKSPAIKADELNPGKR